MKIKKKTKKKGEKKKRKKKEKGFLGRPRGPGAFFQCPGLGLLMPEKIAPRPPFAGRTSLTLPPRPNGCRRVDATPVGFEEREKLMVFYERARAAACMRPISGSAACARTCPRN